VAAAGVKTEGRLLGATLARILAGAWRPDAPALSLSAKDAGATIPNLLRTGAAGLAWWRVRRSEAATLPAAHQLQQAFRLQALHAAIRQVAVAEAATLLRRVGVEAVLGKGWAIARQYPDLALRPYGDIDLYVPEVEHRKAADLIENTNAGPIDLHRGFAELDDRHASDLLARSRLVELDGVPVRIFGEEDHLRLLALHLLRHGGYRPLWLCDIAVALETRSDRFDWDVFLGGSARRSRWAVCALLLAQRLLGASMLDVPAEITGQRLPRWLLTAVLDRWSSSTFVPQGMRAPMRSYVRTPLAGLRALLGRWPNGIEATVGLGGAFNDLPRLPFQVAECVRRAAGFLRSVRAVDFHGRRPQPSG
jgi:hypothetical protein